MEKTAKNVRKNGVIIVYDEYKQRCLAAADEALAAAGAGRKHSGPAAGKHRTVRQGKVVMQISHHLIH